MTDTSQRSVFLARHVLPLVFLSLVLWSSCSRCPGEGRLNPAPPFNLLDLETDALVSLDDFAYPGKTRTGTKRGPVVLDFFRTDCAPCKKALPRLARLYRRLKPGSVHFFVVALLEEKDGWEKLRAYFERHPQPFPVLVDKYDKAAEDYFSSGKEGKKYSINIPALFVVDREGNLRRRIIGKKGEEEFKELERLLRKLSR